LRAARDVGQAETVESKGNLAADAMETHAMALPSRYCALEADRPVLPITYDYDGNIYYGFPR